MITSKTLILYSKLLFVFSLLFFASIKKLSAQDENDESENIDLSEQKVYHSLSKALRHAKVVYKLNLANQNLKEFPLDILKLQKLKVLILDSNQIELLPPQINELRNLQLLSLSYNAIQILPSTIGDLFEMQILYLDNNKLTKLPSEFFRLYKLRKLFLDHNNLIEFPKEIVVLRELVILNIGHNHINNIPSEIGKLYNLEQLSFENNQLIKLPDLFFELTNLKSLYLSENAFTSIDSGFVKLKKLEILSFEKNKFTQLPSLIGDLSSLNKLYLENNALETLPIELGNLYNLRILNIENNPIKSIPSSLKNLKNLKKFYVKKISIQPFPQVYYDIQNNGTIISGLIGKELYQTKLLLSQARNKKLIENYTEAIPKYLELLKLDTNNVEGLSELAICYLESGEYDKADNTCKQALLKDPSIKLVGEIQITYSNSRNKTNKLVNIISSYEVKIKTNPLNVETYFEYGKYHYNQGKMEDAKRVFGKAIIINPNHAYSHFYLAVVNLTMDQKEQFIFSALRYISLEPNTNKTKTLLPFLLTKMSMKTGVENKRGSTSYFDSYIIRDENNEIIYKSEMPGADILLAMMIDLTKSSLMKEDKSDSDSTKNIKKIVVEALNSNKNNVEIFQNELSNMCKTPYDTLPQTEQFSWNYYLPYYKSLIKNGHLETFAYLINAARREEPYIGKWINLNFKKIDLFNTWSENYKWATN